LSLGRRLFAILAGYLPFCCIIYVLDTDCLPFYYIVHVGLKRLSGEWRKLFDEIYDTLLLLLE
jgi:hypothetical protein